MKWMNKLERKLGPNFGIPNLLFILSACQLIIYFSSNLLLQRGTNLYALLAFDKSLILQGEVWRLFSYIILPPSNEFFFLLLALYFQCIIGYYLEQEWDTLGINLYFFIGVILTSVGGLLSGQAYIEYLFMSLFLALAMIYPNMQFLLFFVIPVKAKYLAYVDGFLFIVTLLLAPWSAKLSALLALGNFFLFFGGDFIKRIRDFFRYRKQRQNFRKHQK